MPILAPTSALNFWDRLDAIQKAVRQRMLATADFFWWPIRSKVWAQGTVPSGITLTGMSTGQTWDTTKDNPWAMVNKSTPDLLDVPTTWRVVFDHCDPDKVVQSDIVSFTNGGVLTWNTIANYVTSAQIPSVASLEGRKWYIVRADRHFWWSDRVMDWPNAREWAKGTVSEYHDDPDHTDVVTNPTSSSIKDEDGEWIGDHLVGKDLLLYAAGDNLLKRVTVLTADEGTRVITFAPQAWTPKTSSPFVVVKPGGRAYPARGPFYPFTFYRGEKTSYVTHLPDDTISSISLPASTKILPLFNTLTSTCGTPVVAWDRDVYVDEVTEDDLLCGAKPDKHYTPFLYKTFRDGVQVALQDASWSYVENKSFEGAVAIPLLGPARTFKAAGINHYTTTTTTVEVTGINVTSNTVNFDSVAFPFTPIEVHFAVKLASGEYKSGFGLATSNTRLSAYPEVPGVDFFEVANHQAKELVISLGWTRFARREFRRMFAKTCFVPDTTDEGVILPEDIDYDETGCLGAGVWERRSASDKYTDPTYPQSQFPDAKGEIREGIEGFAEDDVARYAGDNAVNPSVRATGEAKVADGSDPLVQYYDHFVTVTHPPAIQRLIRAQLSGRVTSGSRTQLTDANADWFQSQWYEGGVLREETGTATSGSDTSLTDSTKTSGAANCTWAASRFRGFTGSWVGFVVEVLMSGSSFTDPAVVTEKRLITSGDGTTATIGWAVPLSASASGKQYRIREPMWELNRYEGRPLLISKPDPDTGMTLTARTVILGNDDKTLFFGAVGFDLDQTCTYLIQDPPIGGVWKRKGGAWTVPSGADVVRTGVTTPRDFLSDQTRNLPGYVKRYGPMMVRDAICRKNFDEVIAVLGALRKTRRSLDFTNNPGTGAEDNFKSGTGGNDEDWPVTPNLGGPRPAESDWWTYMFQVARTGVACPAASPYDTIASGACGPGFAGNAAGASDGVSPHAFAYGTGHTTTAGAGASATVDRLYAYGKTTVPQPHCPIQNTVHYYVYAQIDTLDHDAGGTCTTVDLGGGEFAKVWEEYQWDANGDSVLFRQFYEYGSDGPSTTVNRVSGSLSPTTLLNPPNAPTEPSPVSCGSLTDLTKFAYRGYVVTMQWAVVDWAFDDL